LDIIDCPHCEGRVIPNASGICPSCQKNVNDLALVAQSRKLLSLRAEINQRRLAGMSLKSALKAMTAEQFDHAMIQQVGAEYERDLAMYSFEVKKFYLVPGIAALVIGLTVTIGSMLYLQRIGTGIIWHGMVVYGLLSTLTGLVKLYHAR